MHQKNYKWPQAVQNWKCVFDNHRQKKTKKQDKVMVLVHWQSRINYLKCPLLMPEPASLNEVGTLHSKQQVTLICNLDLKLCKYLLIK